MTLPDSILVVEDEAITQRYLTDILEEAGVLNVQCLDNAKEVLELTNEVSFAMILMDINIKGPIDGIQLSKMLLKKRQIPIVFISAYNDDETLDEVLKLSPYGFVTKPFTSSEVLATIKVAYKRFLIYEIKENKKEALSIVKITKECSYNLVDASLISQNKSIQLNTKQARLISLLVKHLNHTVPFEELIEYIWGDEVISESSLRTLVYSIRKLLPDIPLYTHSKQGYYLKKDH